MRSSWEQVEIARHGSAWRLLSPVTYHVGGLPSPTGWRVHVPAGFVTDLASVPRPLRWIVDRDSLAPAAIVHDYLLTVEGLDRTIADGVFHEAARATPGVGRWTALGAFLAVLVWGLVTR